MGLGFMGFGFRLRPLLRVYIPEIAGGLWQILHARGSLIWSQEIGSQDMRFPKTRDTFWGSP